MQHKSQADVFQQPVHNYFRYFIVISYFLGGLIGLFILLPRYQLFNQSSWAVFLLYVLMLGQNIVAIYGAILLGQKNLRGARYLYWLSWTSVPVFYSSMISYHSIIGLGFAPLINLPPGHYGAELMIRVGYASALNWFPTYDMYQLGLNLAPVLCIAIIRLWLPHNK